jgi:hypothetical protein
MPDIVGDTRIKQICRLTQEVYRPVREIVIYSSKSEIIR